MDLGGLLAESLARSATTDEEDACIQEALDGLEVTLRRAGEGWCARPFGSLASTLRTRGSDIDVTCMCQGGLPADQSLASLISAKIGPLFWCHPRFRIVEEVLDAKVPLLRLRFDGRLDVDLSCQNSKALQNSRLLRAYADLDERVRSVVVAVKLWAKEAGVCGASRRRLSSYSFTLLAIYFLQVDPEVELPCLPAAAFREEDYQGQDDERIVSYYRGRWSCSLPAVELLRRFFVFYLFWFQLGNEVVSIRLGKRRDATGPHFARLRGRHFQRLHIEDPFILERNLNCVLGFVEEEELRQAFADAALRLNAGVLPIGLDAAALSCQLAGRRSAQEDNDTFMSAGMLKQGRKGTGEYYQAPTLSAQYKAAAPPQGPMAAPLAPPTDEAAPPPREAIPGTPPDDRRDDDTNDRRGRDDASARRDHDHGHNCHRDHDHDCHRDHDHDYHGDCHRRSDDRCGEADPPPAAIVAQLAAPLLEARAPAPDCEYYTVAVAVAPAVISAVILVVAAVATSPDNVTQAMKLHAHVAAVTRSFQAGVALSHAAASGLLATAAQGVLGTTAVGTQPECGPAELAPLAVEGGPTGDSETVGADFGSWFAMKVHVHVAALKHSFLADAELSHAAAPGSTAITAQGVHGTTAVGTQPECGPAEPATLAVEGGPTGDSESVGADFGSWFAMKVHVHVAALKHSFLADAELSHAAAPGSTALTAQGVHGTTAAEIQPECGPAELVPLAVEGGPARDSEASGVDLVAWFFSR